VRFAALRSSADSSTSPSRFGIVSSSSSSSTSSSRASVLRRLGPCGREEPGQVPRRRPIALAQSLFGQRMSGWRSDEVEFDRLDQLFAER
jgi:hypothetical protein